MKQREAITIYREKRMSYLDSSVGDRLTSNIC
jgi:hypothetical protein